MTLVAPPILSRSELVDASILLAKRHFFTILRACWPALLAAIVLDVVIDFSVPSPVVLFAMPFSLMLWGLTEGMALAGCWELLHGREVTAGNAWRLVSGMAWAIAIAYAIKWFVILIGLLLLLAPGVYLIGRWFAVPLTCVTEQATMEGAFSRSWELSHLNVKRVVLTLGLVELGLMIVAIGIPALLPNAAEGSLSVWQVAAQWTLGLAFLPLRIALTTLLYRDIRIRREGYDLQSALSDLTDRAAAS